MQIILPTRADEKPTPPPPHRAPTLARYTDAHGVLYEVKTNRTRSAFWLMSSKDGYKMSGTLRTSSKKLAGEWLAAMAEQAFVSPYRQA